MVAIECYEDHLKIVASNILISPQTSLLFSLYNEFLVLSFAYIKFKIKKVKRPMLKTEIDQMLLFYLVLVYRASPNFPSLLFKKMLFST